MAFRTYSTKLEKTDAQATLVVAGLSDSVLFTSSAYYAALGAGSHVLTYKRSISLGIDGQLVSANGATVSGGSSAGASDIRIGATGSVTANGGVAFEIAGAVLDFVNHGAVSGIGGLASTAADAVVTNSGSIVGRVAVDLAGSAALIDNSGEIVGREVGLRITGDGGQQLLNSGHIAGGRGTGVKIDASGDILIANSGTISGGIAINLDAGGGGDFGTRTLVNTGTISGTNAIYGTLYGDTIRNDGTIVGAVSLYSGDDLFDGRAGTSAGLVDGGSGDDRLVGSLAARSVLGGGNGDDELTGGDADDLLIGGDGEDWVDGGNGFDIASYRDGSERVVIVMGDFSSESDTLVSIEGVEGTGFDDILVGDDARNRLIGGAGNDQMRGGDGADVLVGGSGDDEFHTDALDRVVEAAGGGYDIVYADASMFTPLNVEVLTLEATTGTQSGWGNAQDNIIQGGAAANFIGGYEGRDTLTGNGGADTFLFNTAPSAANVDTITDFTAGQDRIALGRGVFAGTGNASGAIASGSFWAGTSAHEADDRIIYDKASGNLFYDVDGTGAAAQVQIAHLDGNPVVAAADIVNY